MHIRAVAKDLLTLGREPRVEAVSLRAAVDSALRMTRSIIQRRARVVTVLPDVPLVRGAQGRLVQVLINLFLNAEQAMGEMPGVAHELRVTLDRHVDAVRCAVTDSGPGIPADQLQQIYKPFVTTKRTGTGGLSFCQQVVAEFGGRLELSSEPGRTTFTMLLPIAS